MTMLSEAARTGIARRIPFGLAPNFVGKCVRIIGKVQDIDRGVMTMENYEGKTIKCELAYELPDCKFLEVMGTVQKDLTLKQEKGDLLFGLGNEIDLKIVEEGLNITFHPQFRQDFEPFTDLSHLKEKTC